MFGIYAFVGIVALSAGMLIARVFGSNANLPAGYLTPTPVIGQAEAAAPATPTPAATPAPSVTAGATSTLTPTVSPATATALPTSTVPPTAPPAGYIEYTVQRGDILKAIAQKYGVTVEEILAINQIPNPDSLNVASVISIPKK